MQIMDNLSGPSVYDFIFQAKHMIYSSQIYLRKNVKLNTYKYQSFTKMHCKPKIKRKLNLDSYVN